MDPCVGQEADNTGQKQEMVISLKAHPQYATAANQAKCHKTAAIQITSLWGQLTFKS